MLNVYFKFLMYAC